MERVTLGILRFCGLGDLVECPICRSPQVVPDGRTGGFLDGSVMALSLALPYPNFSELVLPVKCSSSFSVETFGPRLVTLQFYLPCWIANTPKPGGFKSKQIVGEWTYSIECIDRSKLYLKTKLRSIVNYVWIVWRIPCAMLRDRENRCQIRNTMSEYVRISPYHFQLEHLQMVRLV